MQRGHRVAILDYGYLEFVEAWGSDEAIVEAARMSTGKGFLGWGPITKCKKCGLPPHPHKPEEWHSYVTQERMLCQHERVTEPGDEKLLRYLWENEHSTPFEMAGLVIEVQAPIMVFREWHRHRTQSYNEMSARYIPLPDVNYIPTTERLLINSKTNKQAGTIKGAEELTDMNARLFQEMVGQEYRSQERVYQDGLKHGVPKELARVHLPVGRYSRMRASANLLNWLKFLKLRMAPNAQYEIRQYANTLGSFIAEIFPHTWDLFANGRKKKFLSDFTTDELAQELADRNERSAE
jgi:thymidylate synthase (FAD)